MTRTPGGCGRIGDPRRPAGLESLNEHAAVPAQPEPGVSALDEDGYIVVATGLPPPALEAVVDDIWRFTP